MNIADSGVDDVDGDDFDDVIVEPEVDPLHGCDATVVVDSLVVVAPVWRPEVVMTS